MNFLLCPFSDTKLTQTLDFYLGTQPSGCVKLITTDEFSIYQFADIEKANKFSTIFPSYHQNGLIFLRYTQDGSDPTDPSLIPQYNAVLDQVMGG